MVCVCVCVCVQDKRMRVRHLVTESFNGSTDYCNDFCPQATPHSVAFLLLFLHCKRWIHRCHTSTVAEGLGSRAENKTSGLAGQTEILIGHLYNLIQS